MKIGLGYRQVNLTSFLSMFGSENNWFFSEAHRLNSHSATANVHDVKLGPLNYLSERRH